MSQPSKQRKGWKLQSFIHQNTVYKVGDCALINPENNGAPPYIGKVRDIFQKSADEDDVELLVAWFYRPEEAVGGRKAFHGQMELFASDHLDHVHKNTVIGKCRVHSLKKYEALTQSSDQDFFTRFTYKPANKEFEPDRVPVYCKCEMPYNPDKKMVLCDVCEEWFHVECVGESQASVDQKPSWFCPDCRRDKRQRIDGPGASAPSASTPTTSAAPKQVSQPDAPAHQVVQQQSQAQLPAILQTTTASFGQPGLPVLQSTATQLGPGGGPQHVLHQAQGNGFGAHSGMPHANGVSVTHVPHTMHQFAAANGTHAMSQSTNGSAMPGMGSNGILGGFGPNAHAVAELNNIII